MRHGRVEELLVLVDHFLDLVLYVVLVCLCKLFLPLFDHIGVEGGLEVGVAVLRVLAPLKVLCLDPPPQPDKS